MIQGGIAVNLHSRTTEINEFEVTWGHGAGTFQLMQQKYRSGMVLLIDLLIFLFLERRQLIDKHGIHSWYIDQVHTHVHDIVKKLHA